MNTLNKNNESTPVYDIDPKYDFDEVEEGVIHFLPIVEKILNGEVKLHPISTIGLTKEEFRNKYGS